MRYFPFSIARNTRSYATENAGKNLTVIEFGKLRKTGTFRHDETDNVLPACAEDFAYKKLDNLLSNTRKGTSVLNTPSSVPTNGPISEQTIS